MDVGCAGPWPVDRDRLADALRARGLRLSDAAGTPRVTLEPSRFRDRVIVRGADGVPADLLDRLPHVDADDAAAALTALPATTGGTPPLTIDARTADGLRCLEEAVVALAAGRPVTWIGAAPPLGADLVRRVDAPPPEDAPPAARPDRDAARRLAAAFRLFATAASDAEAIADAVVRARPAAPVRRPSVTVVVTAFDYLATLPDTLSSLRAQTEPADEVIVVDDGSTDGTAGWLAGQSGLTVIAKANGGQASAFNAGFAAATGDVVVFLDADDRLRPDALSRIRGLWRAGTVQLQFGLETIDADGRPLGLYPETRWRAPGDALPRLVATGRLPFMPTSGNAFCRRALARVLPLPEARWRISADLPLALMAAALGPVLHTSEVLGEYRVHGRNHWFDVFGRDPVRRPAVLRQRLAAWRDLLARLPALRPDRHADLRRLRLHRRIVRTTLALGDAPAPQRPAGSAARAVRLAAEAVALAAAARGAPLRARTEHVLQTVALAARGLRAGPFEIAAPDPDTWPFDRPWCDADAAAGPSLRPRLDHGDRLSPDGAPRLADALGWGWETATGRGVTARPRASLAIRLARPAPGWTLALRFDPPPETPPPETPAIRCNGWAVTAERVGGALVVALPGRILERDGDGYLAVLAIEGLRTGAGAPRLTGLSVRLAPLGPLRPAALLRADERHPVGPDARSERLLVEGWDWPGPDGAAARAGTVRIAVATEVRSALVTLVLELDVRTASGGAAVPEASAVGTDLEVYALDGGRRLAVLLPPAAFDGAGAALVTLRFAPDAADGLRPARPVLRAATLHPDRDAAGRPRPAPGRRHAPADLLAAAPPGVSFTDGGAARIERDGAAFDLPAPPGTGRIVATLHLAAAPPPSDDAEGTVAIDGRRIALDLGAATVVRVTADTDAPRVDLRSGGGALTVGWIALEREAEAEAPTGADLSAGLLDADALHSDAVRRDGWHPPAEGALWLATDRAALHLRLPTHPAGRVLAVRVLTLPGRGQRLTVRGPLDAAEAAAGGVETLTLRLPAGADRAVLSVETDRLVTVGRATGADGAALLGGAVLSVALADGGAEEGR